MFFFPLHMKENYRVDSFSCAIHVNGGSKRLDEWTCSWKTYCRKMSFPEIFIPCYLNGLPALGGWKTSYLHIFLDFQSSSSPRIFISHNGGSEKFIIFILLLSMHHSNYYLFHMFLLNMFSVYFSSVELPIVGIFFPLTFYDQCSCPPDFIVCFSYFSFT